MGDWDLATPDTPILFDVVSLKLVSVPVTLVTPPKPRVVLVLVTGSVFVIGAAVVVDVDVGDVRAVAVVANDVVEGVRENCNLGTVDESIALVGAMAVDVDDVVGVVPDAVVDCKKLKPPNEAAVVVGAFVAVEPLSPPSPPGPLSPPRRLDEA